jgi:hypothetical protein
METVETKETICVQRDYHVDGWHEYDLFVEERSDRVVSIQSCLSFQIYVFAFNFPFKIIFKIQMGL